MTGLELGTIENLFWREAMRNGTLELVGTLSHEGMFGVDLHSRATGLIALRSTCILRPHDRDLPRKAVNKGIGLLGHDVGKLCIEDVIKNPAGLKRKRIRESNVTHTYGGGFLIEKFVKESCLYPDAKPEAIRTSRNHHGDLHGDYAYLTPEQLEDIAFARGIDATEATTATVGRDYIEDREKQKGPMSPEKVESIVVKELWAPRATLYGIPTSEVFGVIREQTDLVHDDPERLFNLAA